MARSLVHREFRKPTFNTIEKRNNVENQDEGNNPDLQLSYRPRSMEIGAITCPLLIIFSDCTRPDRKDELFSDFGWSDWQRKWVLC